MLGDEFRLLSVDDMKQTIIENHYTKSIPSGKSIYLNYCDAIVVFSIPANKNISFWLTGEKNKVWELTRLWAPDGHEKNLLTKAISYGVKQISTVIPDLEALISYADPNVGHSGGVYRAASWAYLGQSEEGRYYRSPEGQVVSRRKFHSGSKGMKKAEIEALGYTQEKMPGKLRFARGLTKKARKRIKNMASTRKAIYEDEVCGD